MAATRVILSATLLLPLAFAPALRAQWLGYPTPNVPKTPDGKPNLSAPAPRTSDGKPDLSGMWGWINIGKPCGAACTDTQISREFINIVSTLKGGPPYQPWAKELVRKRSLEQGSGPNATACRATRRASGPTITTNASSKFPAGLSF